MSTSTTVGRPPPRLVRGLFASQHAAPLWFVLRLYLGSVWLQFGLAKLRGGWLSGNPMHDILRAVAQGGTPTPLPAYREVARALLATGMDEVLSVAIPLAEVAVAASLLGGVLLVPTVLGACLLNVNLILSGIASWTFDGRILALQLLLLAGWRAAGFLGLGEPLRSLWSGYREALRGRTG